ncbi:alpha/beta hydrolase family protein [Aliikangiella maris]|uniref:S9 family peptidase n=2 Tax=Aliikangiella maris TaxID=3162458 RepID=A0ABV2BVP9_9GAMM
MKGLINGKSQIAIFDRKTLKPLSSLHFADANGEEIGQYGWLNDERLYARMNIRIGSIGEPYMTGYLYAANWNREKIRQILPSKRRGFKAGDNAYHFNILSLLPSDPEHILIAQQKPGRHAKFTEIFKLNVYSGIKRKVDSSPNRDGNLFADTEGNIRIASGLTELNTRTQVFYRSDNDSDWKKIADYDNGEGGINPLGYSADKDKIYIYYDGKEKSKGVYLLSPETMEMTLRMEIKDDFTIDAPIFNLDFDSSELIGIYRHEEIPQSYFLNSQSDHARLYQTFAKLFPNEKVTILSNTRDRKLIVFHVNSDRNPGVFYLYDQEKNKIRPLIKNRAWIDPSTMAAKKPIRFKARDGLEITGYLTTPTTQQKDLPMVVYVHGGPYGVRDTWYFDSEVQFLANRGYAVLQINYRGSGGRGNDFEFDHYQEMGATMQDDITDGTLWAVEQGVANKQRICIYGASYGGYAALMGAIKEPDLYACAIGYAGVYDINTMKLSDTWEYEHGQYFLENAWGIDNPEFIKERSPVNHVDQLKAKLLLIHGGQDKRCPIEHYEGLTKALDNINYTYESLIEPLEVHGFIKEENQQKVFQTVETFLAKNIGNKAKRPKAN